MISESTSNPSRVIDSVLFRSILLTGTAYGEYGMGASTLLAAESTAMPIVSVDFSADWVESTRSLISRTEDVHLLHVDAGPTGDWGRPLDPSQSDRFLEYVLAPFSTPVKPDVVLVDGRLRVASFLTAAVNMRPGSRIAFDDYRTRSPYHVVEQFLPIARFDGRLAFFVVPDRLPVGPMIEMRNRYLGVLD